MAPPMPSDLFQRENRYIYTSISSTETVYLDAFRDIQSTNFLTPIPILLIVIDVCPVCYKFLQTIYDKKRMKDVKLVSDQPCKSLYHKKLVD